MMKKISIFGLSIASLLSPAKLLAQAPTATPVAIINIQKPDGGYSQLDFFIQNVLTVAFGIAAIAVLIMLVWGAFEWIFSGGDKDSVGKARSRIINALIGLAVLAVAYALGRVAAQFLGFDLTNIKIPAPR